MAKETEEQLKNADSAPTSGELPFFSGCYSHSLDAKGRVVIPQAFRDKLGNPFTIAPSQDFKAICLYSNQEWEALRLRYKSYGNNSKLKQFLIFFDAFSYRDQEFDGQGRILVPSRIRKQILGDEKDVDISGWGNCVRVNASTQFSAMFENFINTIDETEHEIDLLDAAVRG